jgi:CRP-like cAMP-binding protein
MTNELFDFFSNYIILSEEEKEGIRSLDLFTSVKKGTFLLSEGETSDKAYFVLKGCVRFFYIIDGEEKTTDFYTEMEAINPQCVVDKQPSKYYLACVEDSIVSVSTTDMEQSMFEKFPRFESLCRLFSEHQLAKQQTSFDEFKTSSPEQRYIRLMETRPDLFQRVPQHQLASYLGITPQSLSRMRNRISGKTTKL